MTTATVADTTTGGIVHPIRQVTLDDLEAAEAVTASLIGSGASFAGRHAAAVREQGLEAMHTTCYGEADLDAAARAWEAEYAAAHPAPDTWVGPSVQGAEPEPEAGA